MHIIFQNIIQKMLIYRKTYENGSQKKENIIELYLQIENLSETKFTFGSLQLHFYSFTVSQCFPIKQEYLIEYPF